MYKLGLIGAGISRSRMPRLQVYLGKLSGVEIDYRLIDSETLDGFSLQAQVRQAAESGFRGLNITHPFKQQVTALVAPMNDKISAIGAMNTVLLDDGGWVGTSTDYSGFKHGYRHKLQNRKPGKVLIAGGGGVGRALAFALADLGAEHLYVFDTNDAQASDLVGSLVEQGFVASQVAADQFRECMGEVAGLVNATPLGMHKYPGMAFPRGAIGGCEWAFDAVYTPLETEFIRCCREAGMEILTGYDLWFFQGLDAFELYTGINVDCDLARDEALSWLD